MSTQTPHSLKYPLLSEFLTEPMPTQSLHQPRSDYLGNNELSMPDIFYGSDSASRSLREIELQVASDARHNLRDYWRVLSLLPPPEIRLGIKLFVGGFPAFADDADAILQLCRIFLLDGFDIRGLQILHAPVSPAATSGPNNRPFFFVDLMHEEDVDRAIRKLDGAMKLDKELMVSQAGLPNEDELVVGPLVGYQPRRKQVVEVRKLFQGYRVGEISLFYELEAKPPSPGEQLFEDTVQQLLYFCYVRLSECENADAVIKDRHQTLWAGREIFVRRAGDGFSERKTIVLSDTPLGSPGIFYGGN